MNTPTSALQPPVVTETGPAGSFMIELLISYGHPFKDHWAYWVRSHSKHDIGVTIHATGDVRNSFIFEIKRSHNIGLSGEITWKRIPLQWVDAAYFDERAMLNNGVHKFDNQPVCAFDASTFKVQAPRKSLNTVQEVIFMWLLVSYGYISNLSNFSTG